MQFRQTDRFAHAHLSILRELGLRNLGLWAAAFLVVGMASTSWLQAQR
jgi:hypothetical protein